MCQMNVSGISADLEISGDWLLVSDSQHARVFALDPTTTPPYTRTLVAGPRSKKQERRMIRNAGLPRDGPVSTAQMTSPLALVCSPTGLIYVADDEDH